MSALVTGSFGRLKGGHEKEKKLMTEILPKRRVSEVSRLRVESAGAGGVDADCIVFDDSTAALSCHRFHVVTILLLT